MERLNNTLTVNESKNDQDTIDVNNAFIESATKQDDRPVIRRTSRDMSRKKLTVFVSVSVAIGVIILVIIIPILGLRKSG
ncbi:unnamed protein product [Rotaria magnacalcarata]|uniref:Uncharacterized protein n=1 Tax=Rotaria magnacalcarata TaxID=392030 RepID=A0A816N2H5_9BILA|nr:unnamed protein product [Rotaria magnacalcarata]CAF1483681.1 unnamed protein product [Rotaria magnacalcarata]CAF1987635.1 unnamed protein product [Rotaria magnacalcarata]CAF2013726.1 unnamed protein product [Rotaria magnacalcarata]CAF2155081.1 unnamed protein product [Rotaria magnacalcarata]